MDESRLSYLLLRVRSQLERYDNSRHMTRLWWSGTAIAIVMWLMIGLLAGQPMVWPIRILGIGMAAMLAYILTATRHRWSDIKQVAQVVERKHPDLNWKLMTVVDPAGDQDPAIRKLLVRELWQLGVRQRWQDIVGAQQQWQSRIGNLIGAVVCCTLMALLTVVYTAPREAPTAATRPETTALKPGQLVIEPGNTEAERGTSVVVTARFSQQPEGNVRLIATDATGRDVELPMTQVMKDDLFAARLADLTESLKYRVEYEGKRSETFQVEVFEYPALENAVGTIDYPEYTRRDNERLDNVRQVAAVEGSDFQLEVVLNKPVATAQLVAEDGTTIPLQRVETPAADAAGPSVAEPSAEVRNPAEVTGAADTQPSEKAQPGEPSQPAETVPAGPRYVADWKLLKSQKFKLQLVDDDQRHNKFDERFEVQVLPNLRPQVKVKWPAGDVAVSPLEELETQVQAWDDFGILRAGLTYQLAGGEKRTLELGQDMPAEQQHELAHQILMEELAARPDQLLVYHFWAEDVDPRGQPRRTQGELKFAEVRPFEEIFRQSERAGGQQQGAQSGGQQGGGGGGQQTEEMLEVQKQILTATWNLLNSPDGSTTGIPEEPLKVLQESQALNIQQAEERLGEMSDEASAEHLRGAAEAMRSVAKAIEDALAASQQPDGDANPRLQLLEQAIAPEQEAYDRLLKLRMREFDVQQGQNSSSSSSGSASSRMQRQLQNLQLTQDQDRYETATQAQSPTEQAQAQEQRDVLNRLRELARRQQDLNDQLQDLQIALQKADDQQREELQRMLKRLQEQQEQLLRETEQLQMQMNQQGARQETSAQRQQLQQTRQQLQQANEALQQGQVPQALTAGTRAREQFDQMREQMQERTANQFTREMRDLVRQADQIDEVQQQLDQQLVDPTTPATGPPSLRDEPSAEASVDQTVQNQRQQTDGMLKSMQDLVQQAETSQKVLAQDLYDTWRRAQQDQLPQRLEVLEQMVDQGALPLARDQQPAVSESVRRLTDGVRQAAEKVLESDTEALRRARSEIDALAEQLQDELGSQSGQSQPNGEDGEQPGEQQDGQAQGGQQPGQQPGQQQGGQQQGEQQGGQQQGGQQQGQQPGEQQGGQQQGQQPGQQQEGQQQGGQQQGGQQQGGQQQGGQQQGGQQQGGQQQGGQRQGGQRQTGSRDDGGFTAGSGAPIDLLDSVGQGGPISGEQFTEWVDRLREVEDLLPDSDLRNRAAEVRDRATELRREWRRHSREPQWDLVQRDVLAPLVELRMRVQEELVRQSGAENLVPLDRDPVPPQFIEPVRRYYERLGN